MSMKVCENKSFANLQAMIFFKNFNHFVHELEILVGVQNKRVVALIFHALFDSIQIIWNTQRVTVNSCTKETITQNVEIYENLYPLLKSFFPPQFEFHLQNFCSALFVLGIVVRLFLELMKSLL